MSLRGRVLIARKIGVATQTWSRLLAGLQDENGNTCILIFPQHMRDIPAEEFIPEGATLAIKEPHLHVDMVHSPHEFSNNAVYLEKHVLRYTRGPSRRPGGSTTLRQARTFEVPYGILH